LDRLDSEARFVCIRFIRLDAFLFPPSFMIIIICLLYSSDKYRFLNLLQFWVSALLVGFGLIGAVFVIVNLLLRAKSRDMSRLRMKDVEAAYNRVWEESTARDKEEEEDFAQPMSCTSALQTIKQTIGDLHTELEENKRALMSSKKYPRWKTVLFWGGAVGLGNFGRSGKRVQHTNDIDLLFQEAAILNDYFFHLLSSLFVAESAHLKVEQVE
jgi:hypothetical protein